jgi:histidinol-phosphate/aromatic aminotransferase/cobyric acid decarboxylase-like protein/NAD(P)-dependent dehydrogenase (short-subunit alcohol dehydrogenase family)
MTTIILLLCVLILVCILYIAYTSIVALGCKPFRTVEGFANDSYFKKKVVLITGSTRGIGFEVAKQLVENGATVILHGQTWDSVKHAMNNLSHQHGFPADLKRPKEVEALMNHIENTYGRLDILVNNALSLQKHHNTLWETSHTSLDKEFSVNVQSLLQTCQLASRIMRRLNSKGKGLIINVSSGATKESTTDNAPGSYIIAKHAVEKMTTLLANDAPDGITVTCLQINATIKTALTLGLDATNSVEEVVESFIHLMQKRRKDIHGQIIHHGDLRSGETMPTGFEMLMNKASIDEFLPHFKPNSKNVYVLGTQHPLGASEKAKAVITEASAFDLSRYGTQHTQEQVGLQAISHKLDIPHTSICFFPGTLPALEGILQTMVPENDKKHALLASPEEWPMAFSLFEQKKFKVQEVLSTKLQDPKQPETLLPDLKAIAANANHHTGVIYISSPHFPSGQSLRHHDVLEFLKSIPRHIVVIFDQCYAEFDSDPSAVQAHQLIKEYPQVVVIRSLSKFWGLAALRIAYVIAAGPVAQVLRNRILNPFLTDIALKAIAATLSDSDYPEQVKKYYREEKARVTKKLKEANVEVINNDAAPFILVNSHLYTLLLALEKRGITTHQERDHYGHFFMMPIESQETNDKVIQAIIETRARA